jgi:hypothetical protein
MLVKWEVDGATAMGDIMACADIVGGTGSGLINEPPNVEQPR